MHHQTQDESRKPCTVSISRASWGSPVFRGDAAASIASLFDAKRPVHHVLPDRIILQRGEAAETIYQIVSGMVRCCNFSEDGQRQIFQFAGPGDYLGLADFDTWHFTAEAVDHVILRCVPRSWAEAALAKDPELQSALRTIISEELAAREGLMFTLGFMQAEERVQKFLADFAQRRASQGFTVLPMPRRDIADHIGLTVETVSRAFGSLKRKGIIEMRGSDRFRMVSRTDCLAA